YSLAGLRVPGRALVAAGAPRHLYVGGVILFEVPEAAGDWKVLQTLQGEQVGSYFGATLCALEQGGGTVALLVGAPTHYDGRRGGRVYLYRWDQDSLHPSGQLWGAPGHPLGRFGASLAALGDLDGDDLPEVAVGAPLEDEERGAIYIFWGRPGGVELHPRQRLQGAVVAPGRFFGQAVAGGLDLTGDGLEDVVVGMEGHVVVMSPLPPPTHPLSQQDPGVPCDPVEPHLGGSVGQELNRSITQTCFTPHLRLFRCPPTPLTPGFPVRVTVSAALRPLPHSKGPAHSRFCSALWLALAPPFVEVTPQLIRAQGVTEVELLWEVNPLPSYVGGGVGGLLLLLLIVLGLAKCGFFQRNYRERMEREGEGPAEGERPEEGEREGEESPPSGETPKEGDSPS
ncbi:integrin alpha-L-like, partial [Empidonax traillii]|uniref:integrin alpha-L-like n=1 Tax=Empidonax traillii TaxID=164674 RepID=UPI000FFD332C